jgi:endonuclease/exonuclease/phosphatase (EEP) superfamily protein YafD
LKPKRSYKALLANVKHSLRFDLVEESEAISEMGKPEKPEINAKGFKLAVWNLFKGSFGHQFEHDFRSLCHRSDMVLAQEALLSPKSQRFFTEKGFGGVHATSFVRRDQVRDGVLTLSRFATHGRSFRIVSKGTEPLLNTPKVALVCTFKVSGTDKKLMVVNVHSRLFRSPKQAVEEVFHLAEGLPAHHGPLLLAGDFNTFTKRYFDKLTAALVSLGFEWVEIPDDPRSTRAALDHFYIRGLTVSDAAVDTTVKNSDHFPITAKLTFA